MSKNNQKLSFFPQNCHWQFLGKMTDFGFFFLNVKVLAILDIPMAICPEGKVRTLHKHVAYE